jgi:hypothetical protein
MIAAYQALYQFNVDKTNSQYKGPFNQVLSDARVFTPKDTAIVTPNSDTPDSMLQLDLRAEPIVICVPKVEKSRYCSVQLTDIYSFNYGYVGSRATGNDPGCYMVAGRLGREIRRQESRKYFVPRHSFRRRFSALSSSTRLISEM